MQVIKNKCRDPVILTKLVPLIKEFKQVKKLTLKYCRRWAQNERAREYREYVRRAKKEENFRRKEELGKT